jgi:hypothetical protein
MGKRSEWNQCILVRLLRANVIACRINASVAVWSWCILIWTRAVPLSMCFNVNSQLGKTAKAAAASMDTEPSVFASGPSLPFCDGRSSSCSSQSVAVAAKSYKDW